MFNITNRKAKEQTDGRTDKAIFRVHNISCLERDQRTTVSNVFSPVRICHGDWLRYGWIHRVEAGVEGQPRGRRRGGARRPRAPQHARRRRRRLVPAAAAASAADGRSAAGVATAAGGALLVAELLLAAPLGATI